MKAYFDNLNLNESNCRHLESTKETDNWYVAPGSMIKKNLSALQIEMDTLDNLTDPGWYYVDVRNDPNWWSGAIDPTGAVGVVPTKHVIECLPNNVLNLVREKKLRLVIAADREGGPMVCEHYDAFRETHNVIVRLNLPKHSILITQGNKKIERQYEQWCKDNSVDNIYEVMYSNHFDKIFIDSNLPTDLIVKESIANNDSKDFNSLNRVYRPQRGAHLYKLIEDNVLDKGIVSGNDIRLNDQATEFLVGDYLKLQDYFPKFVDGDWSVNNAANQYNIDIYKNSLMTVVTETMFMDDVAFITEKIFKPIVLGHPLILFASVGTLDCLEEMGFKTNWCGIDPKYNQIENNKERFNATHQVLLDWIKLSREEKINRIQDSYDMMKHNFDLIRSRNFYHESLKNVIKSCKDYFNETV